MHSVSAVGGLSTAQTSTTHNRQPGPPDHAKAWGWRAKQAASAEETQGAGAVAGTDTTTSTETPDVVEAADAVEQIAQDAAATLPPPSEADMESVLLGLASGPADGTSQDAAAGYDVAALFV